MLLSVSIQFTKLELDLLYACSVCGLVRRIYTIVQNKNVVWSRGCSIDFTPNQRVIRLIVLCGYTIVNTTLYLTNSR